MFGAVAADRLMQHMNGITLHRRGLKWRHLVLDTHYRMADEVMINGQVDLHYVQSLGMELATLDKAVFDGLIVAIRDVITDAMPDDTAFGDCPVLVGGADAPVALQKIHGTLFYSVLRNFMGKLEIFFCCRQRCLRR